MSGNALLLATAALSIAAGAVHGGDVDGFVRYNGVGVAGVDIDVIDAAGTSLELLDDDTDGDGGFEFTVPDARYRVRFEVPPELPLVSREFVLWPLIGQVIWDLDLELGALLEGVVEADGVPVVGAEVDIVRLDTGADVYTPTDETDATGRFAVRVPRNGTACAISIEPPTGSDRVGVTVITPAIDDDTDLGVIDLDPGFRVSGRVVNGGVGVEDVNLDARLAGTLDEVPLGDDRTGPDGSFELVLPAGTFDLLARPRIPDRLAPVLLDDVTVSADVAVGDLEVGPGVRLHGDVTDPDGVGVPHAQVTLAIADVPVPINGGEANAGGYYELVVSPGTYDVEVVPPAHLMLGSALVPGVEIIADRSLDLAVPADDTPIGGASGFSARRVADGAEVRWHVDRTDRYVAFRIRVREGGRGPATGVPVTDRWLHEGDPALRWQTDGAGAWITAVDPVHRPTDLAYFVEALEASGAVQTEGPVVPTAAPVTPGVPATGRLVARPSPATGSGEVVLELDPFPDGLHGHVSLEVIDVQGRRLLVRSLPASAVRGPIRLDLGGVGAVTDGVLFLRITQGHDVLATTRLARVR